MRLLISGKIHQLTVRHIRIELSAENKKQLLVPKGFAHGYSVIK